MKAFERMEKAEQRRNENKDRQSKRRESDSQPLNSSEKDCKDQNDDQNDDSEPNSKRRRRFVESNRSFSDLIVRFTCRLFITERKADHEQSVKVNHKEIEIDLILLIATWLLRVKRAPLFYRLQ